MVLILTGDMGWDFLSMPTVCYEHLCGTFGDVLTKQADGGYTYIGEDGSYGSRISDGSGSFSGSDGSSGRWETDGTYSYHGVTGAEYVCLADGSISYHGADGTVAHSNVDGSFTYRCADGTFAEGAPGGGGSFHSVDGSWVEWYADGSFSTNGVTVIAGYALCIPYLIILLASNVQEVEDVTDDVETITYERQGSAGNVRSSQRKGTIITAVGLLAIVVLLALVVGLVGRTSPVDVVPSISESTDELHPPLSSADAKDKPYKEVVKAFKDRGFKNVTTESQVDVFGTMLGHAGEVNSVTIADNENYSTDKAYSSDDKVIIVYVQSPFPWDN